MGRVSLGLGDRRCTAVPADLDRWGGRGHFGPRAVHRRECDLDGQSAAWGWARVEGGVVGGGDRPYDREPEPVTVAVAGASGEALEGLK